MNSAQQQSPSTQAGKDRHNSTVAPRQSGGQADRRPSYLSGVKDNLRTVLTDMCSRTYLGDEDMIADFLEATWKLVMPEITGSYWRGVEHGASGRVKPKGQRQHAASQ